ncbi:MAG TPA: hypothetical protein VIJ01_07675 [Candidatus Angelobacter sp.]
MATPELQPLEALKPEGCLIVEPAPAPQSGFAKLMGQAKQFSELGIAIPALLYTCGFVVLGCYGEENSLGLQVFPAIQFFSAGAGFLIILASSVLLIVVVRQLLNKCFNWLNSGTRTSKRVRKVIPWILGGAFALFYLAGMFHLERIRVAALYAITITLFFSAEDWVQKLARYYLYFVAFVLGVLSLALYAFSLYPAIPASFGGGKPRHAHIQVDMKVLPGEVSQQLQPNATSGNLEADVYLVTDSAVLIRVPQPEKPGNGATPCAKKPPHIILQLRRSDVSAIFWDEAR